MTLAEKLLAIQSELNVPKNRENKFSGFKYRNCEDILNAAKPLLKEHKALLTICDEIVQIGERFYVKATAVLRDAEIDSAADSVSYYSTGYAREDESKKGMDASQLTGATSSYARKTALCGLFDIDDGVDSDKTNVKKCADCGNAIEKHDKYSGAQIAAMSKKKYGKPLCFDCSVKRKESKEKKDAQ